VKSFSVLIIALAGAALATGAFAAGPLDGRLAGWTGAGAPPHLDDVWDLARGPGHPPGRRGTPPPLNEAAAAKLKTYMAKPGHASQTANCVPPGMPQVMDVPYPIEILFAPGKIVIEEEGYMQVRHVHADGRPHPDDPDLTFNGDSISHWEGSTLVVDTVALAPEVELAEGVGHGDKTRIVERFSLIGPDLLDVKTTVTDPAVLSKPWEYDTHFRRRHDWDIQEYVCQQNNHEFVDPSGRLGVKLN
jgi:hypothetical protein